MSVTQSSFGESRWNLRLTTSSAVATPCSRFILAGPSEPGDPGLTHQDSDETLADPNAHPEGQLGVDAPTPVGLPGGGVDLPNQTSEPLPAHLRRRHRPLVVLVVAGAADPEEEEEAAELGPMTGLDESVDYRVNPCGLGRSSPNSLDAFFFELSNAFLRFRQLDTLGRRDPGAFAPVDLILPDPVMNRGSTDAEFDGGSGDRFAGPDERNGSSSELDREGSWHG